MELEFDSKRIFCSILLLLSIFILIASTEAENRSACTTYYASDYSVLNGAYVSGSFPASVQRMDSDYLTIRSVALDTMASTYPSEYSLMGSTIWLLGNASNLAADDSVCMTLRSYHSGTDTSDLVNNNTSDVDFSPDKGIHSDFSAQQTGPDSINDTLMEEDTGEGERTSYYDPTSDVSTEWYANSGDHYGAVDDGVREPTIPNVDEYIYESRDGNIDEIVLPTPTESGITSIKVWVFSDTGDNAKTTIYLQNNDTTQATITVNPNSSSAWRSATWYSPGSLGTITTEFVHEKQGGGSSQNSTVYASYIEVTYTHINYELDLEVQWTNATHDMANEELCIFGGAMAAESIRVDVWNGTAWQNLFTDLTIGWNNVSVSPYLISSTFTIRFQGSMETSDTAQDSWDIDVTLLHVWSDEYAVEVEFIGSSNMEDWTHLDWAVDSAWTISSVSVTLQLYNYTFGGYSTSGSGYVAYTSDDTPDTDEDISQVTDVTPTDFRNATGYWKMKIKGVKTTDSQFEFRADWVAFRGYRSEHVISTEFIFSGLTMTAATELNLTVISHFNIPDVSITIQIWNYSSSKYAESSESYLEYVSDGVNESKTLSISANPIIHVSEGNVRVKITSMSTKPYQQEINQIELLYSYSTADGQPFDWGSVLLCALPILFGVLLLLILKRRGRKKTEPEKTKLKKSQRSGSSSRKKTHIFSRSFGMTHKQMVGKKILLEIDPTGDYKKGLFDFVSEARYNRENMFIFTSANSTLHSRFLGTENVEFFLLASKASSTQQISKKETLLPASDLSVLLNTFIGIQKVKGTENVNILFDNLSDTILLCGFEKTYKFIRWLLEATSSPKATTLFVFNPTAHDLATSSSIRGLFQIRFAYAENGPRIGTL